MPECEVVAEIVRADRRRIIPLFLGALIFVVGAVNVVGRGGGPAAAIGTAALVFFGACLVTSVLFLIRPPIIVFFGPHGVAAPSGFRRLRAPLVPWSAIKALRVYRFEAAAFGSGTRMLGLVPTDPDDDLWTGRRLRRANRRLTGLPLSVPGNLIRGELEQLVESFRRYKEDLPVEYGEPRAAGMGWLTRPPRRKGKH